MYADREGDDHAPLAPRLRRIGRRHTAAVEALHAFLTMRAGGKHAAARALDQLKRSSQPPTPQRKSRTNG